MKKFSDFLKFLREDHVRVSQNEMAKLLGVSPRTYQYYEEGKSCPTINGVENFCKKLKIKPLDFYKLFYDPESPFQTRTRISAVDLFLKKK